MITRFKRWIVFRWLGVIEPNELLTLAKDRHLNHALNQWYQQMADQMINLYFKEDKDA